MRRLMRADLRRILHKKGFWLWNIFFLLYQLVNSIDYMDSAPDTIMTSCQNRLGGIWFLIITIYTYLSVFADDAQSNSEVIVTGRGLKKSRFLTAKLLDCMVLAILFYAFISAFRQFFFKTVEPPLLTDRQLRLLMAYSLFMVIRAAWCLSFALLVHYLTGNTAMGVLSVVVTAFLARLVLMVAQTLYRVGIYDYVPGGLIDAAFRNLAAGKIPWQIAVVIVFYIGGALWAAAAIFQKKEMEL